MLDKLKDKYIDYKRSQWKPNKHGWFKGMTVTWNWMAIFSFGKQKGNSFVIKDFYDGGIETQCGEMISDFWLKRVG